DGRVGRRRRLVTGARQAVAGQHAPRAVAALLRRKDAELRAGPRRRHAGAGRARLKAITVELADPRRQVVDARDDPEERNQTAHALTISHAGVSVRRRKSCVSVESECGIASVDAVLPQIDPRVAPEADALLLQDLTLHRGADRILDRHVGQALAAQAD